MKLYEFIVTYSDFSTCKEECSRFQYVGDSLDFISTLPPTTMGTLFCFGPYVDSSYSIDLTKKDWRILLLENIIEFFTYNLGEFK